MTRLTGWVLAGGILLALASPAKAQFGITVGNPYGGGGYVGNPGYVNGGYVANPGYSNGGYVANPGYVNGGYNPYYGGGTTYYSSGYSGYAPATTIVRQNYVYSTPYPAYRTGVYRPFSYGYGGGVRRWGGLRGW